MAVLRSLLRVTSASMAAFCSLLAIPARCITRAACLYASLAQALTSIVALFLLSFGIGAAIFLALVSGICLSARSAWEGFWDRWPSRTLRKLLRMGMMSEGEVRLHLGFSSTFRR